MRLLHIISVPVPYNVVDFIVTFNTKAALFNMSQFCGMHRVTDNKQLDVKCAAVMQNIDQQSQSYHLDEVAHYCIRRDLWDSCLKFN